MKVRLRQCSFVIIYSRFVPSSKCGPHDFDPL